MEEKASTDPSRESFNAKASEENRRKVTSSVLTSPLLEETTEIPRKNELLEDSLSLDQGDVQSRLEEILTSKISLEEQKLDEIGLSKEAIETIKELLSEKAQKAVIAILSEFPTLATRLIIDKKEDKEDDRGSSVGVDMTDDDKICITLPKVSDSFVIDVIEMMEETNGFVPSTMRSDVPRPKTTEEAMNFIFFHELAHAIQLINSHKTPGVSTRNLEGLFILPSTESDSLRRAGHVLGHLDIIGMMKPASEEETDDLVELLTNKRVEHDGRRYSPWRFLVMHMELSEEKKIGQNFREKFLKEFDHQEYGEELFQACLSCIDVLEKTQLSLDEIFSKDRDDFFIEL